MENEITKQCVEAISSSEMYTAIASASAAVVAAALAFFSYLLSKKIYDEIKSDEEVIAGPLVHPGLANREHDKCLLMFTLFNKSKRKTHIDSIKAFDSKGDEIEATWSTRIDNVGNIQDPTGLIGVIDNVNVFIRRNDGEKFDKTTLKIRHSFSDVSLVVTFEPFKRWQ
ncbi:hypothetical protein [Methylobacter sp. BlB1]|uniref:hypothetical protein n=1 Tax=Methylobacter sp. BlB1 TaxID=2785914 RepID=UPI0018955188|nr:hypothetical protein [Methylobacter sp. BlB1]MBF6647467.1 hypothetical protein [Methylobacter sp. BlB1]